jgi:hypothetical protein
MTVKTVDVQITGDVWLRCDERPISGRGCQVYAVRVDGEVWEPGNVPEQESAADIALGMHFDCVYLHGEDGAEQVITLHRVA